MKLLPHVALFLALGGAFGSASPRQQVEPPLVLSVRTDLVTLPVTVVDRHGKSIAGLRKEDFTVYDNGKQQPIQFFTNEDLPATVGLVIDSSGSMRGRRHEVTAAAAAFADMSHPLDEFFTVNFNEAVWLGLPPRVDFTEDMDELRVVLAAAPARGMTALYDAVDRALDHLGLGTRDRKALIVVSDGGDNASSTTLDEVLEHARRTNAVIYAVSLADPDDPEVRPRVLKKLARETGGDAFRPTRSEDVMRSFVRIAAELRSGYTIGFIPPETTDGGFRPVRVVVDSGDHRQLTVRTRAGYYAEPPRRTDR
jgi:Ca-activated chloride channel family protein